MSAPSALKSLAQEWAERAQADLDVSTGRPLRWVAGATRKSCAWELLRTLSEMEKENPSEDGLIPPHDADRESA